jgi:hypothetical protein
MPLVDVATATRELRLSLEAGEDADLARKLVSAEEQAVLFLGRNIYATQEALTTAVAAAPAALSAASTAYDTAMAAAALVSVTTERELHERLARGTYNAAIEAWERTVYGMVINDSIRTAILLTAGSLWEHRGDEDNVQGIPPAAYNYLWPFRRGLGV